MDLTSATESRMESKPIMGLALVSKEASADSSQYSLMGPAPTPEAEAGNLRQLMSFMKSFSDKMETGKNELKNDMKAMKAGQEAVSADVNALSAKMDHYDTELNKINNDMTELKIDQ